MIRFTVHTSKRTYIYYADSKSEAKKKAESHGHKVIRVRQISNKR